MFTACAVTSSTRRGHDGEVFADRARAALVRAAIGLLVALPLAGAALPASAVSGDPTPAPSTGAGASDGAGQASSPDLVTFGMSTASGDKPDDRGFISVSAPPGSTLYDGVAVFNLSDVALPIDVYPTDATNDEDGGISLSARADTTTEVGKWTSLGASSLNVPAQSTATGPGAVIVPVTISIPAGAEPGDHSGSVVASITAEGQANGNSPAINFEQRTSVRIYVRVQGDIRPGLTITGVHSEFLAGGAFGTGKLEVEYTLTNSGNVRYGIEPSVRATGPFGLAPHGADGGKIAELLPHASVKQSVTLEGIFPLLLENVTVSAKAVAPPAGDDPAIGTVRASTWMWLWSWLILLIVVAIAAAVATGVIQRRRRRPGVWGPPGGPRGGGGTPPVTGGGPGHAPASQPPAPAPRSPAPERVL